MHGAEFYIVHDTALEEIHLLTNQSPPFATLCRVASKADIRASFIQNSQEMCRTSWKRVLVLRKQETKLQCQKKKQCSSQIKIFVFYSKGKVSSWGLIRAISESIFVYPSSPVSLLSCISPVLHPSFPASHLSCIPPFMHPTFPASHLSCIPLFLHPSGIPSYSASLQSWITPVLNPTCPASHLSCTVSFMSTVQHLSCSASLMSWTLLFLRFLHPSSPESLLFPNPSFHVSSQVLNPSIPASLLSCIPLVLHLLCSHKRYETRREVHNFKENMPNYLTKQCFAFLSFAKQLAKRSKLGKTVTCFVQFFISRN